jgi:triacylglycerol esterase/lipase EstA (alpha/beta hydrolase family)
MRVWTTAFVAALAALLFASAASAADDQLLLVHGHGSATAGKDCNGDTWADALSYYQSAGGRERSSMTTIGYYTGDKGQCDAMLGDANAGNDRPIQDIARDLARYIDSRHAPVDVIAHSMGGLIVRVALVGSAEGWDGFPKGKLDVDNVVTLSTPHQGVADPSADNDPQWRQMTPGSGFIKRLHESSLTAGTDWTFIGSHEDTTVSYESGIDKGNGADQKLGYLDADDAGEVTHSGIRTQHGSDRYSLSYWHASGDHPPHQTGAGWSPLKAAFQAATHDGDNLPK